MKSHLVFGGVAGLLVASGALAAIPEKGSYQEAIYCASSLALSAGVMGMSESSDSKDLAKQHEAAAETWIGIANQRTGKDEDAVMGDFDKLFDSMSDRLLSGDRATAAAMVEEAATCLESVES